VFSAAALRFGMSIAGEPTLERGDEMGDRGSSPSCERFSLFVGGAGTAKESEGGVVVFGVGRCARDPTGNWIPSDGKESDFRRVL